MQKRTLFIGDVHGCYDELMELLTKIRLTPEDHLYFVGDLINKGPKSLEVVEFVRNRPNTFSVSGNHEYFLMQRDMLVLADFSHATWLEREWESAYALRDELSEHIDFLTHLPTIIEKPDFILVHAGLHPDFGVETSKEVATVIRMHDGKPWYDFYTGSKKIIYGHWAVDGLRIRKNTIGLDSGCVFGGHLSAYCLETTEVWQVHAHDVYKIPADHKGKIIKGSLKNFEPCIRSDQHLLRSL